MRNIILTRFALFLVASLLSGCAIIPFIPFLPAMGSAYEGYVFWKSGKATKYYAFDLETTYKSVMQTSDQLKIEPTLTNSVPKEKYSLETKGNIPMHIDVIRLDKSVTTVTTSIPTFGDKHYVELFYRLVDENLPKKADVYKEKTP